MVFPVQTKVTLLITDIVPSIVGFTEHRLTKDP